MWTADFWKDLLERLFWTFIEAFIGALTATTFIEIDALGAAAIAAIGAVASALKSIAAAKLKALNDKPKNEQTAQLGARTYRYNG